jgi:hypothetical protein
VQVASLALSSVPPAREVIKHFGGLVHGAPVGEGRRPTPTGAHR